MNDSRIPELSFDEKEAIRRLSDEIINKERFDELFKSYVTSRVMTGMAPVSPSKARIPDGIIKPYAKSLMVTGKGYILAKTSNEGWNENEGWDVRLASRDEMEAQWIVARPSCSKCGAKELENFMTSKRDGRDICMECFKGLQACIMAKEVGEVRKDAG